MWTCVEQGTCLRYIHLLHGFKIAHVMVSVRAMRRHYISGLELNVQVEASQQMEREAQITFSLVNRNVSGLLHKRRA